MHCWIGEKGNKTPQTVRTAAFTTMHRISDKDFMPQQLQQINQPLAVSAGS